MKTDDFEKRLQRQPQREIPSMWREKILTAARSAEHDAEVFHPASHPTHPGFLSTLIHQLSTLTRPQRIAWASLVGLWLIILGMNFSLRENSSTTIAASTAAPSPEALAAWRRQYRALAALTEITPSRPIVAPSKPTIPQPRSNRRPEWLAA